jgi:uncharacterized membrane protein
MANLICPVSGCDEVNTSSYSMIAGIPVALFGVIGFLIIINLNILKLTNKLYYPFYSILTSIGFFFGTYLTYLEIVYIKAICFWCFSVYIIMTILFLDAIQGLIKTFKN